MEEKKKLNYKLFAWILVVLMVVLGFFYVQQLFNVRELENQIERAVVLCHETALSVKYFQFDREVSSTSTAPGVEGIVPGMALREVEKRLILSTLNAENNNRTRASEVLGISVRTLRNKLNEYSKEGIYIKS